LPLERQLCDARIVVARPVRFAGDRADDALGEARLRESFRQAGLGEVDVAYEPEAAGFRFARALMAIVKLRMRGPGWILYVLPSGPRYEVVSK